MNKPAMNEPTVYKNFAFISYSRKDSKVAAWLQKRIEWFRFPIKLVSAERRPPHTRYVRPIYRDKTSLEVTDEHFWLNIRRALEESRYLIVLGSPHSAASAPVNMEVEHFLKTHDGDTSLVVPVIVGGDLTGEGPDAALCPALRALGDALINRNLPTMVPDAVTAEQDAWEQGFVSLVSYLLSLERTALGDHIQRETKRQASVLRRWLVAVGMLTVIAGVLGLLTFKAKREVEQANVEIVEKSQAVRKANDVIVQRNKAVETANREIAAKNDEIVAKNKINLENLHEASMADYSVAVQRIEKESRWRDGVAHLARALDWEPGNGLAAARLYSGIVLDAPNKVDNLRQVFRHKNSVLNASFSPDGTRIVTASKDYTAQIWDAATGQPLGKPMQHKYGVTSASFSPDGSRILTASEDWTDDERSVARKTGEARLWDAVTGQMMGAPMRHDDPVKRASFSPDGTRIVTASQDGTARIWDAMTGRPLGAPMRHELAVTTASFSPDGTRIVTASIDYTARVWNASTGKPLGEPIRHTRYEVSSASFSPDGQRIVTASGDHFARIWDAATGKPLAAPMHHDHMLNGAVFSPDGTRIVTACWDDTARLWDAATGKPLGNPMKHENRVTSAAFSPDGRRIITASADHSARIWDSATGQPLSEPMAHVGEVNGASFSPDGTRIVTTGDAMEIGDPGDARLWDATVGKTPGEPMRHGRAVRDACFSPDGTRIVTASWDKTARLWAVTTGQPVGEPMRHDEPVNTARFSFDGTRIVTAGGTRGVAADSETDSGAARLWDVATGRSIGQPMRHQGAVFGANISPDGTRIVVASGMTQYTKQSKQSGDARMWDVATSAPVGEPMRLEEHVGSALFSPDGRRVVTVSGISTVLEQRSAVRFWDAATGQPLGKLPTQKIQFTSASFSADGARIVTADLNGTVQVYDPDTYQPLGAPLSHDTQVTCANFSPDGSRIVTTTAYRRGGTAQLWNVATGQALGRPLWHDEYVHRANFSPDGRCVVTAGEDGTARLWEVDSLLHLPIETPAWVRPWARAVASRRFDGDGVLQSMGWDERNKILQTPHDGDDPWSRLARWLATDPAKRTTHPDSPHTCRQVAERERDSGFKEGIESSLRYDPTVPLSHVLLAKFEENPQRADFLRGYGLKLLPNDATLWARAATSLVEQKDFKRAMTAADKALALDPKNEAAQKARAAAAK